MPKPALKPTNRTPAQPGDILLFYNAGGLTRLITWFTHSPFYHVGISAGDDRVFEARPRGVVCRDLRAVGENNYLVIPYADKGGAQALAWAQEQLGDQYDAIGVAILVLERLFTNLHLNVKPSRNRFSCGELVLCSFHEVGVDLLPGKTPDTVVPADFAELLPAAQRANRRFRRRRAANPRS